MDNPIQDVLNKESSQRSSMTSLLIWNVSKVFEKNPLIDLQKAIKTAQEKIEAAETLDVDSIVSENPEERHLLCALLAWQEMGHSDPDALYRFIVSDYPNILPKVNTNFRRNYLNNLGQHQQFAPSVTYANMKFNPLVFSCEHGCKVSKKDSRDIMKNEEVMKKVGKACNMNDDITKKLKVLEESLRRLRDRSANLAKRETERIELLNRAEKTWEELDRGYQRQISAAQGKEETYLQKTRPMMKEREELKSKCAQLAQTLKDLTEAVEKHNKKLKDVEKEVCNCAVDKHKLQESCADKKLAELTANACQLERDQQLEEEQMKRKQHLLRCDLESTHIICAELERAQREELREVRKQAGDCTQRLLQADADNCALKKKIEDIKKEKEKVNENYLECKVICDKRKQEKLAEYNEKKERLNDLETKRIECRCKHPIETAVQVQRTPSFATLCACSPEDKLCATCSCTSLRTKLLTTTLNDLFGGLHLEFDTEGIKMPCHLLLCLEDKHSWEKNTPIKSNLRMYFANLLKGEIDHAIVRSIEKYHIKWMGPVCVDLKSKNMCPWCWQKKVDTFAAGTMTSSTRIAHVSRTTRHSGKIPSLLSPPLPSPPKRACIKSKTGSTQTPSSGKARRRRKSAEGTKTRPDECGKACKQNDELYSECDCSTDKGEGELPDEEKEKGKEAEVPLFHCEVKTRTPWASPDRNGNSTPPTKLEPDHNDAELSKIMQDLKNIVLEQKLQSHRSMFTHSDMSRNESKRPTKCVNGCTKNTNKLLPRKCYKKTLNSEYYDQSHLTNMKNANKKGRERLHSKQTNDTSTSIKSKDFIPSPNNKLHKNILRNKFQKGETSNTQLKVSTTTSCPNDFVTPKINKEDEKNKGTDISESYARVNIVQVKSSTSITRKWNSIPFAEKIQFCHENDKMMCESYEIYDNIIIDIGPQEIHQQNDDCIYTQVFYNPEIQIQEVNNQTSSYNLHKEKKSGYIVSKNEIGNVQEHTNNISKTRCSTYDEKISNGISLQETIFDFQTHDTSKIVILVKDENIVELQNHWIDGSDVALNVKGSKEIGTVINNSLSPLINDKGDLVSSSHENYEIDRCEYVNLKETPPMYEIAQTEKSFKNCTNWKRSEGFLTQEDHKAKLFKLLRKFKKIGLNKDSEDASTDENWDRVYKLLVKYLKKKIDRLQNVPDSMRKKGLILPQETEIIYAMIDKDFQRLQHISKLQEDQ